MLLAAGFARAALLLGPRTARWRRSSLARAGQHPANALDRVLDGLGRVLEPVYGFRSLLAFQAKFQPQYRPLHLVYPDPAALPAIGTAVGRAYLPHLTARQTARLLRRITRR